MRVPNVLRSRRRTIAAGVLVAGLISAAGFGMTLTAAAETLPTPPTAPPTAPPTPPTAPPTPPTALPTPPTAP